MKHLSLHRYLLVLLISLLSIPFAALATLDTPVTEKNPLLVNGVIHSIKFDTGEIVVDGIPYTFDPTTVGLIDSNNLSIKSADLQAGLPVVMTLSAPDSTVITAIQLGRDLFVPAEDSIMAEQTPVSAEAE